LESTCDGTNIFISFYLLENDAMAYDIFMKIAQTLSSDATGVMIIPSLDCYHERNDDTANPWWRHVVKDVGAIKTAV
jgi:hypothetical protein